MLYFHRINFFEINKREGLKEHFEKGITTSCIVDAFINSNSSCNTECVLLFNGGYE